MSIDFNINFDALKQRKIDRDERAIEFNLKKEKYFEFYRECFIKRGYDARNEFLFKELTQFCGAYCMSVNSKGLFLCAENSKKAVINTGIGKTFGMQVISDIFTLRIESVVKLSKAYTGNVELFEDMLNAPNYYRSKKTNDLIIDEVGAETITSNYGNKQEIFANILETRYLDFIQKGSYTHFTSNLTPKEIENRYGHRVWSRINEMCTVIEVSGKDNRFE